MANTFPTGTVANKANSISGATLDYPTVLCTNDATTSAKLAKVGYAFGCIENHTGSAVTITWWGSMTAAGTAHALEDQDQAAVQSIFGEDHRLQELPSALAGVPFVVPVSDNATDTVAVHFER
jgi:hypothetical protein